MGILYPQEGSAVYVPRELDGSRGAVVAEAVHRDARARIFWHLDAEYLGVTEDLHTMPIQPLPGEHVLTLVDGNGETVERRFTALARE
jgi:penicillin-binding protein 1C